MSIAFGSILIFLIFTPGIIFRLNYFTSVFSKKQLKPSVVDDIIWSSIPALLIHMFGLLAVKHFTDYHINVQYLGHLLSGTSDASIKTSIFNNIQTFKTEIIIYNLWINFLAIPLGNLLREFVRLKGYDIRFRRLRFPNRWFYILRGEALQFPHVTNRLDTKYKIDSFIVDALVNVDNEKVIYTGILHDFYTGKDGELDSILIEGPLKSAFNVNATTEHDYNGIPSSQFLIPYKYTLNLNLRYYTFNISGKETEIENYRSKVKKADNWDYYQKIFLAIFSISIVSLLPCVFICKEFLWIEISISTLLLLLWIIAKYLQRKIEKRAENILDNAYTSDIKFHLINKYSTNNTLIE